MVGQEIAIYFIIWLLGMAVVICAPREEQKKSGMAMAALIALSLLLFLLSLTCYGAHLIKSVFITDLIVGVTFAVFMYAMLWLRTGSINKLYSNIADKTAGFSYTLYLVHFPFLCFLGDSVLRVRNSWKFDVVHLSYGFVICILMLCYSIVIAHFTEAKTGRVRQKITCIMGSLQRIYLSEEL